MKALYIFLVLVPLSTFCQIATDYHNLPIPQSEILGRPLLDLNIRKGIVQPVPSSPPKGLTYEYFDGPAHSQLFVKKLTDVMIPVFKRNKLRIVDINIDSLKIKAIAPENFSNGKITSGVFAYDGIVADTIRVTYRTSIQTTVKPAELLDSLDKYIPSGAWKNVSNLAKKITIGGKDSIERVMKIVNPDVVFAARFVKYQAVKPVKGEDFENKYKLFDQTALTDLSIEEGYDSGVSETRTPQYRGGEDDLTHPYFLRLVGEQNNLRLIFVLDEPTNASNKDGYRIVKEIPYTEKAGVRTFDLGYRTVDRYIDRHGNDRLVRIAVYGKQVSPTSVQIQNYKRKNKPVTYMKYPYFKFEYITQM